MEEFAVNRAMILIAVSTCLIGLLILAVSRISPDYAGEPLPPGMKRNAIILTLSGPVSLGLWYLFNGVLHGVGYRSVIGYALAALVFIGGGFLTGLFTRLRARRVADPEEEKESGGGRE